MIGSNRKPSPPTAVKSAAKLPVISSLAEKRKQRKREKLNTSQDKSLQSCATGGEFLDKTAMSLATLEQTMHRQADDDTTLSCIVPKKTSIES